MYSRKKVILGAIALVAGTFLLTSAMFVTLLKVKTTDVLQFMKFFQVLGIVKTHYVEGSEPRGLVDGAIKGMVAALNDPHSIYLDAKMYKQFQIETEGAFAGVGVVIGMREKQITVVSPIEGTPGEQAGIKSGDQILKIDNRDTTNMTLDEAATMIRGKEGTQVVLAIRRNADKEIKDYILTRSIVHLKTVVGKMLDERIGYIRISMFNDGTADEFVAAYKDLESKNMKALVLDLRDNPGGLLDVCVKVAQYLVPKGPVVSVVERNAKPEVYHSYSEGMPKYPLVVLVNEGSASASEIIAGAVQDTKAGTLIGTKTYGKGSVQSVYRLDRETAVKLTIAKYLTPGGRSINGVGIEPDVAVANPENLQAKGEDVAKDPQLTKGIEMLKSKL